LNFWAFLLLLGLSPIGLRGGFEVLEPPLLSLVPAEEGAV